MPLVHLEEVERPAPAPHEHGPDRRRPGADRLRANESARMGRAAGRASASVRSAAAAGDDQGTYGGRRGRRAEGDAPHVDLVPGRGGSGPAAGGVVVRRPVVDAGEQVVEAWAPGG